MDAPGEDRDGEAGVLGLRDQGHQSQRSLADSSCWSDDWASLSAQQFSCSGGGAT